MAAYLLAEAKTLDEAGVIAYAKAAGPTIVAYGGRFLAQGQPPAAVEEGSWPEGYVVTVIEFPDIEKAKAWYASEAYQQAIQVRKGKMDIRLTFIDGKWADGRDIG